MESNSNQTLTLGTLTKYIDRLIHRVHIQMVTY